MVIIPFKLCLCALNNNNNIINNNNNNTVSIRP